jgi:hypothetical protein
MDEQLVNSLLPLIIIAGVLYGVSRINYIIDDRYVRIRIGTFSLRKYAISDIRDARAKYSLWSESWANVLYPTTISKRAVTIYRKSGWFKKVLITPDNPEGFIERIKTHGCFVPDV